MQALLLQEHTRGRTGPLMMSPERSLGHAVCSNEDCLRGMPALLSELPMGTFDCLFTQLGMLLWQHVIAVTFAVLVQVVPGTGGAEHV